MPELRWILGLVGIGVLIALYFWGRRRGTPVDRDTGSARVEPSLQGQGLSQKTQDIPDISRAADSGWDEEPDRGAGAVGSPQSEPQSGDSGPGPDEDQKKILVLYVRAAARADFTGPQLLEAFRGEGLEFGKYGVFHLVDDSGEPIFSIANMVEPGDFPETDLDSFKTGGLTIFMVLPGPAGIDGLARMIACSRKLASILGGEVLDETGSTLTNQRATHMKEEAIEFLRRTQIEAVDSGSPWRS